MGFFFQKKKKKKKKKTITIYGFFRSIKIKMRKIN